MKHSLEQLAEQFVSAQKTISRVQPLLSMYAYPVCAELFVERGVEPDLKKLKKCERILIKKAGLFSDFSGTSSLVIIALLSMSDDPEAMYDRLKDLTFPENLRVNTFLLGISEDNAPGTHRIVGEISV